MTSQDKLRLAKRIITALEALTPAQQAGLVQVLRASAGWSTELRRALVVLEGDGLDALDRFAVISCVAALVGESEPVG